MTDTLKSIRVDSTAGSSTGRERFANYEEYIAPLWSIQATQEENSAFQWRTELHHLGHAMLGQTWATGHVSERNAGLVGRMGLDHILVLARRSGKAWLDADTGEHVSVGRGVSFLDMSRPLSARVTHVDVVTIGFPRVLIAPLVRDVDSLHGLVLPRETPLGALAAAHLDALAEEAPQLKLADALAVSTATVSLLAVCADRAMIEPALVRIRARPALLLTIRRHIERSLTSPNLTPDGIARQFGLSRSTIYRLFQPLGGVDRYVRRRRLIRAYKVLSAGSANGGDYIYQVATACGFSSDSAFSHAFRREFAMTPRALIGQRVGGEGLPSRPEEGGDLRSWLHDLS